MTHRILVTGGAGFIGSAVVRHLIESTTHHVANLDKLTYAGNLESLTSIANSSRYRFYQVDICNAAALDEVFAAFRPTAVMHLAAESHVDRSIDGPAEFIQTNMVGTFELLEAVRAYWSALPTEDKAAFRFLHVSTDEVYGSLSETDPAFSETTPYAPNSPYSASKAGSDHLVRAYHHTYGLPTLTTNCSNNYGPYHFPEKLIPLMILNALEGKALPVYGDGQNIRDWLYVRDHCEAIRQVLAKGRLGETYNVGGKNEIRNLDVVQVICAKLDALRPKADGTSYASQITFVADRPGHDRRYAIDPTKIEAEIGWTPAESFETGIDKTVKWYLENTAWIDSVRTGAYREWVSKNYSTRD